MKRGTRKILAIVLSVAMVFSTVALTPADFQKNVWAITNEDISDSLVTEFSYDFAYTTPGYADGTIRISASEDGVYKVFWGDAEGNKLTKNGYEYSYLARVIVKDGKGSYNIVSDYTVIPEDAATVLVYKKDALQYVYDIPAERLFTPSGEGFTFGALADFHYGRYSTVYDDDAVPAGDKALAFLDGIGVDFVGVAGDLTSEGEQTSLDKYNAAINKYPNMTVISSIGNHDSRSTVSTSDTSKLDTSLIRWNDSLTSTYFTVNGDGFTSNLGDKYTVTSIGPSLTSEYREVAEGEILEKEIPALDLTVTYGDNAFIFLNEISKTGTTYDVDKLLTTEQLDWLAEQFEVNKDKNVFFFAHSYLPVNTLNGDVVDNDNPTGDLKNNGGYSYDLDFKDYVTTSNGENILALLKKYDNVTMITGHSHWQYAMQEINEGLNIGRVNNGKGGTLVHVSSVTEPRYIGANDANRTELNGYASEGSTATIYDDCIVYNGIDFYNDQYEAYATYIVPSGDDSAFEPVKDPSYREATDVVTGDEYLGAEDMTLTQLLKSTYNLMYGAAYTYTSKGDEGSDGALTDGVSTGTTFVCTKPNKKSDQTLTVELEGVQDVSNLKSFMLYFVNGLTDCSDFNIKLSLDGENWETVGTYTNMTYKTNELAVDTSALTIEQYKYVQLNLCGGTKAYGYQIKEFAAIGYERNTTPNTAGSSSSLVEGEIDEEDYLDTDYNLIYGAEYTQSSVGGEDTAGALTNGKTSGGFMNTERNASAKNQEIIIDMGKGNKQPVNNIDYLLLYNQNALTNVTHFTVSVSLDGETYETIGAYSNVDVDTSHFDVDLSEVTLEEFRYVKLNFTNGNTGYGYQIKEFAIIGVNPIEYPEIADQSSRVSSATKNLALGKTLIISSTNAGEGNDTTVLNDGKKDKYWSSDWDNTRTSDYIIVDLGEEVHTSTIGSVLVNFKSNNTYCDNYTVEFSKTYNEEDPAEGFYEVAKTKASSWEILQKKADPNGYVVTEITDVEPDTVRYVKVNMKGHGAYGFQIYEVAVLVKEMNLTSSEANVSIEDAEYTYTGSAIKPAVTVTYAGVALTEGTDYTVTYADNTNAGEAKYTVTGKGNYGGSVSGTFTINSKNIEDEDVVYDYDAYMTQYGGFVYNGEPQIQGCYISYNDDYLDGDDYTVTYSDNINPGTVTVKIEGIGNFIGTKTYTYTIVAAPMECVSVDASYDADGNLVVVAKNGNVDMVEGQDYTVTEETDENNNTVIKVTAAGTNYSGTFTKTIYDLANVTVDDSNLKDYEFEGKDKTPIVILTHDGEQLNVNADYEVTYENNFYPGTATITIKGIGDYKGEIVRNFNIVKRDIGNVTIRTSFDANKQLVVTVNNGSTAMTKEVDYTYNVVTDANGKITITFTGMGDNYSGTCVKVIEAKDNPNRPQETTTVAPTTKAPTTKVPTTKAPTTKAPETTVKVAKTKVKSATKKRVAKKVKISLKKIKGAQKYQVQISKKKKFSKKNILVKKTVKRVKIAISSKKIKNKKKLFIRARAVKVVKGKKYYGKWSTVKKIKITK